MKPFSLSPGAAFALERLESRGYEAYAVGGCVRDSLLGTTPHDWDLTTSATPEETEAAFADCRLIDIGKKHGTVAVLYRGEQLEITTYRTDGDYADNRHPSSVTFSRNLRDDLARRDFTVNAMAYHPVRGLVDLFGGEEDLRAGIIRCVGDAKTRFREDGLRILRAVRFASVLGFSVEAQTAEAIHGGLPLLRNIARERVREEWSRLLCGKAAPEILRDFSDLVCELFPEAIPAVTYPLRTETHCFGLWDHTVEAIAAAPEDLLIRLALFFHDLGKPQVCVGTPKGDRFPDHQKAGSEFADRAMRRMRYDNASRREVVALVLQHDASLPQTEAGIRRLLTELSPETLKRLLILKRCDRLAHAPAYRSPHPEVEKAEELLRLILERGDCYSLRDLAVTGEDLIRAGFAPGKELGRLLERLLGAVVDGVVPNDKAALLEYAETQK